MSFNLNRSNLYIQTLFGTEEKRSEERKDDLSLLVDQENFSDYFLAFRYSFTNLRKFSFLRLCSAGLEQSVYPSLKFRYSSVYLTEYEFR